MGAETGATAAQIEDAARRALAEGDRDIPVVPQAIMRAATMWAADLVPPGYRIVGPDAVVLDAEQAALFERAAKACDHMARVDTIETRAIYWRENAEQLRALAEHLGGAGDGRS